MEKKKYRKPLACYFGWHKWCERHENGQPVIRDCNACGQVDVWNGDRWVEDPSQYRTSPVMKSFAKDVVEMLEAQQAEREVRQKELAAQRAAKVKLDALMPWFKRQIANATRNRNRNLRLYAPDEDKPNDYGDPAHLARYKYWEGVADGLKKTQTFLSQDDTQPPSK